MEPILIVTDKAHNDIAAVQSFEMDLAYGTDEQDFEISFESPLLTGGELVYLDGTAYGGVVDVVETESNSTITTYRGRTWHGILAGKILAPDADKDYITVSGDANECIAYVINRTGLSSIMTASSAKSGITISNYKFSRFVNAYDGLVDMLSASGAKLVMRRVSGTVEISAEPVVTIANEVDSDVMQFTQSVNYRVPNHLVCAGEGELQQRVRLDLYADAKGNISQTQTFRGVDEIAVYYDYNGADKAKLLEDGTKTLKEMQVQGNVEADVDGVGEWDVGDVIVATDNRIGRTVSAQIVKKVVKVSAGNLTVSYEVGLPTATGSRITDSTESAGTVYTAGEGIKIASGVISAEVTQAELDAVSGVANKAVETIEGVAPVSATKSGKTYSVSVAEATESSAGLMSAADKKALDDGIASVSSAHTQLTLSNVGSGKVMHLYRNGNIVIAHMDYTAQVAKANTPYNCGTVPVGFRPQQAAYYSGAAVSSNAFNGYFRWDVATNGAITYLCSTTSLRESQMLMAWSTADPFPS